MAGALDEFASALRIAHHCLYGIAALVWLAALGIACYRIHQMRTLIQVDAEVLDSYIESSTEVVNTTDIDGYRTDSEMTTHIPVARVRYKFNGKEYTTEARTDTASSFRWLQDRTARRWKPGSRISVHIDPAKPDRPIPELGFNLHTFQMPLVLAIAGFFFAGLGDGLRWVVMFFRQFFIRQ